MTTPSGVLRRLRNERGSTTVLVAVLLPLMLAFTGVGAGVAVLSGAERELQRAARTAALAAASQMTLVNFAELNEVALPPLGCEDPAAACNATAAYTLSQQLLQQSNAAGTPPARDMTGGTTADGPVAAPPVIGDPDPASPPKRRATRFQQEVFQQEIVDPAVDPIAGGSGTEDPSPEPTTEPDTGGGEAIVPVLPEPTEEPIPDPDPLIEDPLTGTDPLIEDPLTGTDPLIEDPLTGTDPLIEDPLTGTDPLIEDPLTGTDPTDPLSNPLVTDPLAGLDDFPAWPPFAPSARQIACAIAAANLDDGALMVGAFGTREGMQWPTTEPAVGRCEPDPTSGITALAALEAPKQAMVAVEVRSDVFDPTIDQLQALLDGDINNAPTLPPPFGTVNLRNLLPSLIAPQVEVTAFSRIHTPLGGLLTDGDDSGAMMGATATARRLLKNAVVLPSTAIVCTIPGDIAATLDATVVSLLPSSDTLPGGQSAQEAVEAGLHAVFDDGSGTGDLVTSYEFLVQVLIPQWPGLGAEAANLLLPFCSVPDMNAALAEFGGQMMEALDRLAGHLAWIEQQGAMGLVPALPSVPPAEQDVCVPDPLSELPPVCVNDQLQALIDMENHLLGALPQLPVTPSCLVSALRHELSAIYEPPGETGSSAEAIASDIIAQAQHADPALDEDVAVIVVNSVDSIAEATSPFAIPILDVLPVASNQLGSDSPLTAGDGDGIYRSVVIEESPLPSTNSVAGGCDVTPSPITDTLAGLPPPIADPSPTESPAAAVAIPVVAGLPWRRRSGGAEPGA